MRTIKKNMKKIELLVQAREMCDAYSSINAERHAHFNILFFLVFSWWLNDPNKPLLLFQLRNR